MNPPSDIPSAEAVDLRALLLLAAMNADDDDDDDDDDTDDDGSSIKVVRACLAVVGCTGDRGENEVTSDSLLLHIAAARAAAVENLMLECTSTCSKK